MTDSPKNSLEPDSSEYTKARIGRWFWGAIFFLVIVNVSLTLVPLAKAYWSDPGSQNLAETQVQEAQPEEMLAEDLDGFLSGAISDALIAVHNEIPEALEAVYQPVYAAIPAYADFHYSVWGSYAELAAGALGDPENVMREKLLGGFETRLAAQSERLEQSFRDTFVRELESRVKETGRNPAQLGPLTSKILEDAKDQTLKSAQTTIVTAGTAKALSLALGKKLGGKIAAKVAAKAGSKWAGSAAGAGGAAALCAWAGPGAAICAVGGAAAAWLATDAAVGRLDEYFHRDEFMRDLRLFIDEDRHAREEGLKRVFAKWAVELNTQSEHNLQDFSLRELSGPAYGRVCDLAKSFETRYAAIRTSLIHRNPEEIADFRIQLDQSAEDLVLRPLVRELQTNIDQALKISVTALRLQGNFPRGAKVNRKITATIDVERNRTSIRRLPATMAKGFNATAQTRFGLRSPNQLAVRLHIQQHLRLKNRVLSAATVVDIFDSLGNETQLTAQVPVYLSLSPERFAPAHAVINPDGNTADLASVTLHLTAPAIPSLSAKPKCRD